MIAAHINGDIKQVEIGTTIFNLVTDLDIAHKKIALEINGEIIPPATLNLEYYKMEIK